ELVQRCEELGMKPRRAYGMTECPTVSASMGDDGPEVRLGTDGRILPGVHVRAVDADGSDVVPGAVGEFLVRGPQRALGYLDPQHTRDGFDADGWFRSGDLGFVDAPGSAVAISCSRTPSAASGGPAAPRTSSTAGARSSRPRRSKRSCAAIPR